MTKRTKKTIALSILSVLNLNRPVTDNQWTYRKGYSTDLLLVHLTEIWRHAVDTGYVVGVAFRKPLIA